MASQKVHKPVTPAKAGVQNSLISLDSAAVAPIGLKNRTSCPACAEMKNRWFLTFYESITY